VADKPSEHGSVGCFKGVVWYSLQIAGHSTFLASGSIIDGGFLLVGRRWQYHRARTTRGYIPSASRTFHKNTPTLAERWARRRLTKSPDKIYHYHATSPN
jgi:hypothetical protein